MKWPIYFHSSTSAIGSKLGAELKIIFNFIMQDLKRYLDSYSLKEELLRDFIHAWNELNHEKFIPVFKDLVKFLRHRLLDGSVITFHRIIHLVNAMIRNCGTIAQIIIGREQFLRTLLYLIPIFAKRKEILAKESATFAFFCLKEWTSVLRQRKDLFPYYEKIAWKLSQRKFVLVDLSGFKVTHIELIPVKLEEEIRITSKGKEQLEDDSTIDRPITIEVNDEDLSISILSTNTPPLFTAEEVKTIKTVLSAANLRRKEKDMAEKRQSDSTAGNSSITASAPLRIITEAVDHTDDLSTANNTYQGQQEQQSSLPQQQQNDSLVTTKTIQYDSTSPKQTEKTLAQSPSTSPMRKAKSDFKPIFTETKEIISSHKDNLIDSIDSNDRNMVALPSSIPSSPSSRPSSSMTMKKHVSDVTFKYYGTQRVVCYHKSMSNEDIYLDPNMIKMP